jgi:hypothetical protein
MIMCTEYYWSPHKLKANKIYCAAIEVPCAYFSSNYRNIRVLGFQKEKTLDASIQYIQYVPLG